MTPVELIKETVRVCTKPGRPSRLSLFFLPFLGGGGGASIRIQRTVAASRGGRDCIRVQLTATSVTRLNHFLSGRTSSPFTTLFSQDAPLPNLQFQLPMCCFFALVSSSRVAGVHRRYLLSAFELLSLIHPPTHSTNYDVQLYIFPFFSSSLFEWIASTPPRSWIPPQKAPAKAAHRC